MSDDGRFLTRPRGWDLGPGRAGEDWGHDNELPAPYDDGSAQWSTWGGQQTISPDKASDSPIGAFELARAAFPYPQVANVMLAAIGPGGGGQTCRFFVLGGIGRVELIRTFDIVVAQNNHAPAQNTTLQVNGRFVRVQARMQVAGVGGNFVAQATIAPQLPLWLHEEWMERTGRR